MVLLRARQGVGKRGRSARRELGGEAVPADDVPAIVRALRRTAEGKLHPPDEAARSAYAYPATAERMVEAMEEAVANSRRRAND